MAPGALRMIIAAESHFDSGRNALCSLVSEIFFSKIVKEVVHDLVIFHDFPNQLLHRVRERKKIDTFRPC